MINLNHYGRKSEGNLNLINNYMIEEVNRREYENAEKVLKPSYIYIQIKSIKHFNKFLTQRIISMLSVNSVVNNFSVNYKFDLNLQNLNRINH